MGIFFSYLVDKFDDFYYVFIMLNAWLEVNVANPVPLPSLLNKFDIDSPWGVVLPAVLLFIPLQWERVRVGHNETKIYKPQLSTKNLSEKLATLTYQPHKTGSIYFFIGHRERSSLDMETWIFNMELMTYLIDINFCEYQVLQG